MPEFEDFSALGDKTFGIFVDLSKKGGLPMIYSIMGNAWTSYVSKREKIDVRNRLQQESERLKKELEKRFKKQGLDSALIEFNTLWPELEAEILSDIFPVVIDRVSYEYSDLINGTAGFFERVDRSMKVKRESEANLAFAAFAGYLASQFKKTMQVEKDKGLDKSYGLSLFKYKIALPLLSNLFNHAKASLKDSKANPFFSEPSLALVEDGFGNKKIVYNAATYMSGLGIEDYRVIRAKVIDIADASVSRLGDFGGIFETEVEKDSIEKIIHEVPRDRATVLLGNDPDLQELY